MIPCTLQEMANVDRTQRARDLPKLEGCLTRGTQYRWTTFRPFYSALPAGSRVLDVGCGSLLETHFMAKQGMRVTGIDLDADKLKEFQHRHDWTGLHAPDLRAVSLQSVGNAGETFDVVTAFDVIEHLENLEVSLAEIRAVLRPGGLLFITTPNALTLSEAYGWLLLRTGRLFGRRPAPGAPHLQIHTPSGWRRRLEAAGFTVRAWDMAIGPVANSMMVLATAPVQVALAGLQVLGVIGRETRHSMSYRWSGLLSDTWVPRFLKGIDDLIAPIATPLFAWNLIVLEVPAHSPRAADS